MHIIENSGIPQGRLAVREEDRRLESERPSVDLPSLRTREDAVQFIKENYERLDLRWNRENGQLEGGAEPSVLRVLSELLDLKSYEDWQAVRLKIGMGKARHRATGTRTGRPLSPKEQEEREQAFWWIEREGPVCPYCGWRFRTLTAAKSHVTKVHIGKDWKWYGPSR